MFRVRFGLNDNAIPLCSCDKQLAYSMRLRINPVDLYHCHIILVKLKILSCESTHVDNTEKVGFIRFDWEMHILCLVDQCSIWNRLGAAVDVIVV